ncbi:hypothetical protein [Brevundimonas sp. TWP1-2-1b1]
MFLLSFLAALFSFPSLGEPTPAEVQNEIDYQACFSTDDPQTCIDNLEPN